jgi:hypothetical protein
MTKDKALVLSDALVEIGVTHTIVVGVADNHNPRVCYSINVTPVLTYSSTDITRLQRLADQHKLGVAFIAGSFTFTREGVQ